MKTSWQTLAKIFILVFIWFSAVHFVSLWTIQQYGIVPHYPYYNQIREHLAVNASVWAGFDGIHYLRLARSWYLDAGTQAFFPLFPGIIRGMVQLGVEPSLHILWLNLIGLAAGLFGLWLMWGKKSWFPILALLAFPTSFFFSAVYTESLFFALSVWFFLLLKRKQWWLAAALAGIASSTRLVGALLGLSLLIASWREYRRLTLPLLCQLLLSESGLIAYMFYLYLRFKDPLIFMHVQSLFGAERSSNTLILLPQVLFRYVKMIFTVDPHTWMYLRIWGELLIFLGALGLWLKKWRSLPWEYSLYILGSLLLPSATGTLSSLPRYALVLVPWLVYPLRISSKLQLAWLTVSILLLFAATAVFSYGLFVA